MPTDAVDTRPGSKSPPAKNKVGSIETVERADDSDSQASVVQPKTGVRVAFGKQTFNNVAYYRGTIVAVKHLQRRNIQIARKIQLEFREVSFRSAFRTVFNTQ